LPEGIRHVRGALRNLVSCADEFRRLVHDVVLDMIPMREREARDVMRVFEGIAWRVALPLAAVTCVQGLRPGHGQRPWPTGPVPLDKEARLREKFYSCKGKEMRSTRRYWSRRRL
jgi:hypothetical protein